MESNIEQTKNTEVSGERPAYVATGKGYNKRKWGLKNGIMKRKEIIFALTRAPEDMPELLSRTRRELDNLEKELAEFRKTGAPYGAKGN